MEAYKDKAMFVLRLFLGLAFLVAGLDKLVHLSMSSQMFAGLFGGAGTVLLWVAIVAEIVGGAFLLIGYQTRWAATVLAVLILVAFITTFSVPAGTDFIALLRNIVVMNQAGANTAVNWAYFAGLLAMAMGGSGSPAVQEE